MTAEGTAEWLISESDDHVLGTAAGRVARPYGGSETPRQGTSTCARLRGRGLGIRGQADGDSLDSERSQARAREQFSLSPSPTTKCGPDAADSVARLDDMNRVGVLASSAFHRFPGSADRSFSKHKDRALAPHCCVQAYNDWMIDECGAVWRLAAISR